MNNLSLKTLSIEEMEKIEGGTCGGYGAVIGAGIMGFVAGGGPVGALVCIGSYLLTCS